MNTEQRKKPPATLQERFGFKDPDLTTPKHDEIMLWLDSNMQSIVDHVFEADALAHDWAEETDAMNRSWLPAMEAEIAKAKEVKSWHKPEHAAQRVALLESLKVGPGPAPPWPGLKIKKTWEYPIKNDRDFMIGFVDMLVHVRFSSVYLGNTVDSGAFKPDQWAYTHDWTGTLMQLSQHQQKKDYLPKWRIASGGYDQEKHLYFEVKPSIPSLGELLRQIRSYGDLGHVYVVSPDDRFKEQIEAQRVGFIKYPG